MIDKQFKPVTPEDEKLLAAAYAADCFYALICTDTGLVLAVGDFHMLIQETRFYQIIRCDNSSGEWSY